MRKRYTILDREATEKSTDGLVAMADAHTNLPFS